MSTQLFESLCFGLCDLLGQPYVALASTPEGPVAWHLKRDGVTVSFLHFEDASPDHAFILFELGEIPYSDPRAARIVLAMLDCNFLVPDPYAAAFGRNPCTGEAVIRCACPLATTTAADLLKRIDSGVALALEWRQDYFLREHVPGHAASAEVPASAQGSFL
ncbi:MAG: hypothetical protein H7346_11220 [Burkholderiaceae bacterium]|nr:hypothetical protein [Burkholderiaceae bacterium]